MWVYVYIVIHEPYDTTFQKTNSSPFWNPFPYPTISKNLRYSHLRLPPESETPRENHIVNPTVYPPSTPTNIGDPTGKPYCKPYDISTLKPHSNQRPCGKPTPSTLRYIHLRSPPESKNHTANPTVYPPSTPTSIGDPTGKPYHKPYDISTLKPHRNWRP